MPVSLDSALRSRHWRARAGNPSPWISFAFRDGCAGRARARRHRGRARPRL